MGASEWKDKVGVSIKVACVLKDKVGGSIKVASVWKPKGGVANKVGSELKHETGVCQKDARWWRQSGWVSVQRVRATEGVEGALE